MLALSSKFVNTSLLTKNSNFKVTTLHFFLGDKSIIIPNDSVKKLLNKMKHAFASDLNITETTQINLKALQNIFLDFDENINQATDSKFQHDVMNMNTVYSVKLKIKNDNILINFLSNGHQDNLIAAIIHSLNTFCHFFPYNYDGLVINICLDNNYRNIGDNYQMQNNIINLDIAKQINIFQIFKRKSTAFNVSGVTFRQQHHIILTKSEEIIKLLFHEMVHYVGLDKKLYNEPGNTKLPVTTSLNLSEAYTEFMAVLLYVAYCAVHYAKQYNKNININTDDYFCEIFNLETEYSLCLASSILKFYGFNKDTYKDFLTNKIQQNNKIFCPIPIWEYVFFRAQLMLNFATVCECTSDSWKINHTNLKQIIDLTNIDESFVQKLGVYMKNNRLINNISYLLIDFDWNVV